MKYYIRQHTFADGSIYIEQTCNRDKLPQPSSYNGAWGVAYRNCGRPWIKILEELDVEDVSEVRKRKQQWMEKVPSHLLLNVNNAYSEIDWEGSTGQAPMINVNTKDIPDNWWSIYDGSGNLVHVCRTLDDCYVWAELHADVRYDEKGRVLCK